MATPVIQGSFASGELSPSLSARVDLAKYHVGLSLARNFFIDYRGGATNRPGTRFIYSLGAATLPTRMIPFQYSTTQTYILLFADHLMYVIKDGGIVLDHITGLVYSMVTPWAAADLAKLKYTQSADTITLTHPSYPPQNITRSAHDAWSIAAVNFAAIIGAPTILTVTSSAGAGSGSAHYAYIVTAVDQFGNESVASPIVALDNVLNIGAVAGSNVITWTAVGAAVSYNIYKATPVLNNPVAAGAQFGYMANVVGNLSATDSNIIADFSKGPPTYTNYFPGTNDYPGVVTYFQQRRVFAATNNQPETFWMSHPSAFNNFNKSIPIHDDEVITATLASNQVNNIKSMISMPSGLIMLTGGGAWQISAGSQGASLTPKSVQANPQAYSGVSDLQPIVINYDILYVQALGSVVRDLSYNFFANIYTGNDITVLSNHLFYSHQITAWTWAEEPFKLVWACRNDGKLLSLTYLKEQDVYAWAQHDTIGVFDDVCSIPEGTENAVYVTVQRFINGSWVRYIERFQSRLLNSVEDSWFVDAGLDYPLTMINTGTLTFSAVDGNGVTLTRDAGTFTSGDVGKMVRGGGAVANITTYVDSTHVLADVIVPVSAVVPGSPTVPLAVAPGAWSMTAPISHITGLGHLEGQTVSILADGNVFPQQVVTGGSIDINRAASRIIIGLPYTAQCRSLNVDTGEPTIQGKRKKIPAVTLRVEKTRGLWVGEAFDTPTQVNMTLIKERYRQRYGYPIAFISGDERIVIRSGWNTAGQICWEVRDPLPATVLGIIPEIVMGDTAK